MDTNAGDHDLTSWHSRFGRWLAATALGRRNPWLAGNWIILLTLVVGAGATLLLTAISAEIYDSVAERDGLAALDRPVLDAAIAWRTPWLDSAVTWFTDLGGPVGMSVLTLVVAVLLAVLWRSLTPPVLIAVAAAGSLAMTSVGKQLVGRVRPPHADAVPPFESSPSFPSGHTLNSTVIAGVVAYLLVLHLTTRRARWTTVLAGGAWAFGMGLSRVFLGHHWLTDVLVAWTLGLAWLAVVVTCHRLLLTLRRRGDPTSTGTDPPDRPDRHTDD